MRLLFIAIILIPFSGFGLVNGKELAGKADLVRIRLFSDHVCSGVFIDPYTILTAAHCVAEKIDQDNAQKVFLEGERDTRLTVRVRKLIPHPDYAHGFFPYADIGIIKTELNPGFAGDFKISENTLPFRSSATLYGCGRIRAHAHEYFRTVGENNFWKLGQHLIFIGRTKGTSLEEGTGTNVSIAHSDSGGTIVDSSTSSTIAVITQTSVDESNSIFLPTLSVGTSIYEPNNLSFIKKNSGPPH